MWKLFTLFFVVVLFVATAAQTTMSVPEGAQLDKFPIFDRPLTISQIADLGLAPKKLEKTWTGFNLYRGINRYVLETLPIGDFMLVDKAGTIRYRQTCGNRLVGLKECPACPASTGSSSPVLSSRLSGTGNTGGNGTARPGLWSRFAKGLKDSAIGAWGTLGDFLSSLGWLLLGLLAILLRLGVLAAIGYGLYRLFQAIRNNIANRQPVQPQPIVGPNPVPQPNPVPPVQPQPVQPAPNPVVPVLPGAWRVNMTPNGMNWQGPVQVLNFGVDANGNNFINFQ